MAETPANGSLKFFYMGLVCWNMAVSIDSTALGVALPTISHQLGATSTEAFWCGTAFTLCSAAFQPIYSLFSDAFGRKPMLLTALTFFTIGSIICGVAHQTAVLLVGRSVQGAGGGGLLTMTYVLMTDFCTLQQRHKAITALSLTWLVGTVVGPIMSGVFTQHASWRWIFWLNIPFCVLSYIVVLFLIKTNYKPSQSRLAGLKAIDWLGSITFVGSLVSFLVPLSWGGIMYPWTSWRTYVPLTIGIGGLILWFLYSLFFRKRPMIPLSIMANRTVAIHYFGNLMHGIIQFGGLYYLPLYYQTVLAYSPTISGVAMLSQCVIAAPFSAIAAVVIAKLNSVKPLILTSWILLTIGAGMFRFLEPTTKIPVWIALNIPCAIGIGSLFGGLALATQAAAEVSGSRSQDEVQRIKGMAASLNAFFRTLGQALGIVIAQAAFTNEMKRRAGQKLASDAASLGQVIEQYPKGSPQRTGLVHDYNESLHTVWFVLCGLAGCMVLLTLFVKDVGPSGENKGFLGFGGLKETSPKTKPMKNIKIVRPSESMAALKEASWGVRERESSEGSLELSSSIGSSISSNRSSVNSKDKSAAVTNESKELDFGFDNNVTSPRTRDAYMSVYSPRPSDALLNPDLRSPSSATFPPLSLPLTPEMPQEAWGETNSPSSTLRGEGVQATDFTSNLSRNLSTKTHQAMESVTSSVLEIMMKEVDGAEGRGELAEGTAGEVAGRKGEDMV